MFNSALCQIASKVVDDLRIYRHLRRCDPKLVTSISHLVEWGIAL